MTQRHSMTGYGRGEHSSDTLRVTVELRSVNHRFLDLNMKLPRSWMPLERAIGGLLRDRLARGRVDVFVKREPVGDAAPAARLDEALVRSVVSASERAAELTGLPADLGVAQLMALPGVLTFAEPAADVDAEGPQLLAAVEVALEALVAMRLAEGTRLAQDLAGRLSNIEQLVDDIAERAAGAPEILRKRLMRRLGELKGEVALDPARVAQEVALLADKAAVDEEVTRLRSHVVAARALLAEHEPVGRKFDFLVQEFHREANTVGSKSSDEQLTATVLSLKSEVEKIREQVANLE